LCGRAGNGQKINVGVGKLTDTIDICRYLNQFNAEITNFVLIIKQ